MNAKFLLGMRPTEGTEGRRFRELGSVVSSPYASALESASNRDLLKRAAVLALLVVLGLLAVIRSQHDRRRERDVAKAGQCYIARDGGTAWHRVRQCRALANVTHVERVAIADIRRPGAGARGRRPCRLCAGALRRDSDNRDRWAEMEPLLRRPAVAGRPGP